MNAPEHNAVQAFKSLYNELDYAKVRSGLIKTVYTENMHFEDNFHSVDGRAAFETYCLGLYKNVGFVEFDFLEDFFHGGGCMLNWVMHYSHPRLNSGKTISVEGASLLRLEFEDKIQKVSFHKDYFDAGSMIYEHVPVVGRLIKGIKSQVSS